MAVSTHPGAEEFPSFGAPLMFEAMLRQVLYPAPQIPVPSPPPAPLEEWAVEANGQPVSAWFHRASTASAVEVAALFLHGNGENLETVRYGGMFQQLGNLGVSCLAIDYPGYGRTGGEPNQGSLTAAAVAAWDRLGEEMPRCRRLLVGWSLGSAVAAQVACQRQGEPAAVVLLSPWDDLRSLAKVHFSSFLMGVANPDPYDSCAALATVQCPVLLIHGEDDDLIPISHARRLRDRIDPPPRFLSLPGVGHNDLLGQTAMWKAMKACIEEVRSKDREAHDEGSEGDAP